MSLAGLVFCLAGLVFCRLKQIGKCFFPWIPARFLLGFLIKNLTMLLDCYLFPLIYDSLPSKSILISYLSAESLA